MTTLSQWSALASRVPPKIMAKARTIATQKFRLLELKHGRQAAREIVLRELSRLTPPQEREAESLAPLVALSQVLRAIIDKENRK